MIKFNWVAFFTTNCFVLFGDLAEWWRLKEQMFQYTFSFWLKKWWNSNQSVFEWKRNWTNKYGKNFWFSSGPPIKCYARVHTQWLMCWMNKGRSKKKKPARVWAWNKGMYNVNCTFQTFVNHQLKPVERPIFRWRAYICIDSGTQKPMLEMLSSSFFSCQFKLVVLVHRLERTIKCTKISKTWISCVA